MRRAKIVATLGPASQDEDTIEALVCAGMDVARLNLSHGDREVHERVFQRVRRAADVTGRAVGVLVDLQGPKIRLGRFADGPHDLEPGDLFTITTEDVQGTKDYCGTTFAPLVRDAAPGDTLLIDDGRVRRRDRERRRGVPLTEVVVGGTVSDNKGINLPGVDV